ncbi:MAG: YbjP/YqhG family protein [Tannerellaceae bacterium]|jgi:hypothetical protein|nr:YbjP/YqhG family protein [Tannerellaceae bacterium]
MKNLYYLLFVFTITVQSCGQSAGNRVSTVTESADGKEEKAIQRLKEFYTAYISCCDSPGKDLKTLSSIRNKYLTESLLYKLENSGLDYDPVIQAQDCDANWIKTIEIHPDTERQNVYTVCYISTYNSEETRIELLLADDNGNYLIDDILNDVNIHENTDASATEQIYVFENDTIKQHIVINRLTDAEMDFRYTVENKLRQQNRVIRGTAKYKYGEIGGVEIDEDEEGNSFPSIEYIYDDECWLALRIDLDTSTIMQIQATDGNLICPLESVGILLKSIE